MSAWDLSCRRSRTSTESNHGERLASTTTGDSKQTHSNDSSNTNQRLASFLAAAAMAGRLLPARKNCDKNTENRHQQLTMGQSGAKKLSLLNNANNNADTTSRVAVERGAPKRRQVSSSSSSSTSLSPSSSSFSLLSSASSSSPPSPSSSDDASHLSSGANRAGPDKRARKKDQNRRAAYNYRRKKLEERDRMMEEEARLVHKHVRLTGKIARLEERILAILSMSTKKVVDQSGFPMWHLCPVCSKPCDNLLNLRAHLKLAHMSMVPSSCPQSSSSSNEHSPVDRQQENRRRTSQMMDLRGRECGDEKKTFKLSDEFLFHSDSDGYSSCDDDN